MTWRNIWIPDILDHKQAFSVRFSDQLTTGHKSTTQILPLMYSKFFQLTRRDIPSRNYTSWFFGRMVLFGRSIWPSCHKFSVVRFLFIRPFGFGLKGKSPIGRYFGFYYSKKRTKCQVLFRMFLTKWQPFWKKIENRIHMNLISILISF